MKIAMNMKQTCLVNAKEDEKGIAGQARNDRPFRIKNGMELHQIMILTNLSKVEIRRI
ncbi:MAG: hypothetical protein LBN37_05180 [Bacteroidales bacterium]|jgi:hypothetical protein|nr:hypothetical protein [Bacteroidales bacterium]